VQARATDARGEDQALHKVAQKLDNQQIGQELRAVLKSELPGGETR
jgi:hypothetical protein